MVAQGNARTARRAECRRNSVFEGLAAEQATILEYEKFVYVTKQSTPCSMRAHPASCLGAQQPFLADTGCIRYVATAMHVSQSRDLKPGAPMSLPLKMSRGSFLQLIHMVPGVDNSRPDFRPKGSRRARVHVVRPDPARHGYADLIHATQDKQIYVLDGALTLTIDGSESVVTAAGLALIPRCARHAYVNKGSAPVHAMFWALPSRKLPALFR